MLTNTIMNQQNMVIHQMQMITYNQGLQNFNILRIKLMISLYIHISLGNESISSINGLTQILRK